MDAKKVLCKIQHLSMSKILYKLSTERTCLKALNVIQTSAHVHMGTHTYMYLPLQLHGQLMWDALRYMCCFY